MNLILTLNFSVQMNLILGTVKPKQGFGYHVGVKPFLLIFSFAKQLTENTHHWTFRSLHRQNSYQGLDKEEYHYKITHF